MTAALRAQSHGLSALIVEKTFKIGGSTCYSGGGLWVPCHGLPGAPPDDLQDALVYMEALVGDVGSASTRERKLAFLENGPKMLGFLQESGLEFVPSGTYPDYYPNVKGGKAGGRCIEPNIFDMNTVPKYWREKMNINPQSPVPAILTYEAAKIYRMATSLQGIGIVFRAMVWNKVVDALTRRRRVTMGISLVAQLLNQCIQRDISIWTNSPMRSLISDSNGAITGAIVSRKGENVSITAKKGVLLAAGGFARNLEMRKKYQEHPITTEWSVTPPEDKGDAITAAMDIGAETALMDDSWWGPTMVNPRTKVASWCQFERAFPHSIVVDSAGNRFTNEAQSYTTFGQDMYARNRTTPAIPAFLIMDAQFRKRYIMAGAPAGSKPPKKQVNDGVVVTAPSLAELASKVGIDSDGLAKTVSRVNGFVETGVDEDFNRGGSVYDQFFGDPAAAYKRNPNLGTIAKGPFYAIKLFPGDLGTKGGVLTDVHARALRPDGSVIENLYAVGNTSASVMGRTYAGAGSTLGPALTFAYVAMNHIAATRA